MKNMQRYLDNQKRQIKRMMEQNNLKKQMVKQKHEELLEEWVNQSLVLAHPKIDKKWNRLDG